MDGDKGTTPAKQAAPPQPQAGSTASPRLSQTEKELQEAKAKLLELKKKAEEERKAAAAQLAEKKRWNGFLKYCKLDQQDLDVLQNKIGIATIEDLKEFGYGEDDAALFRAQGLKPLKARRVQKLATYALLGGDLNSTLTKVDDYLQTHDRSHPSFRLTRDVEEYLNDAGPDTIDKFNNKPEDFEKYWKTATIRLGPTKVGPFLHRKANVKKAHQVAYSLSLHYILAHAFLGTTVEPEIDRVFRDHGADGYETAQAILGHYRSSTTSNADKKRKREVKEEGR